MICEKQLEKYERENIWQVCKIALGHQVAALSANHLHSNKITISNTQLKYVDLLLEDRSGAGEVSLMI